MDNSKGRARKIPGVPEVERIDFKRDWGSGAEGMVCHWERTGCLWWGALVACGPLITPALFSHRTPPDREKREQSEEFAEEIL